MDGALQIEIWLFSCQGIKHTVT